MDGGGWPLWSPILNIRIIAGVDLWSPVPEYDGVYLWSIHLTRSVGADLSCPSPIYRPVHAADKSAPTDRPSSFTLLPLLA